MLPFGSGDHPRSTGARCVRLQSAITARGVSRSGRKLRLADPSRVDRRRREPDQGIALRERSGHRDGERYADPGKPALESDAKPMTGSGTFPPVCFSAETVDSGHTIGDRRKNALGSAIFGRKRMIVGMLEFDPGVEDLQAWSLGRKVGAKCALKPRQECVLDPPPQRREVRLSSLAIVEKCGREDPPFHTAPESDRDFQFVNIEKV